MSVTMRMAGRDGINVGAARDVFLENVVLHRAGELLRDWRPVVGRRRRRGREGWRRWR